MVFNPYLCQGIVLDERRLGALKGLKMPCYMLPCLRCYPRLSFKPNVGHTRFELFMSIEFMAGVLAFSTFVHYYMIVKHDVVSFHLA